MAPGKEQRMDYKWIGAVLIVAGCGGFGFSMAAEHRMQEKSLRKLIGILDYMACELQYRMTSLPELTFAAGTEAGGDLGRVFGRLSDELQASLSADVSDAMTLALKSSPELPEKTRDNLLLLGRTLGRFDLEGQMKGLEAVRAACRRDLESLSANREVRLRNYQTLSLCAGAALAILLI